MNWTPSQKEAISYSGENILLSAAAGSGKTAVLVQRVIEKILDEENPTSINELLILTYTEAAAAEMKRKIATAINEEFLKNPKSAHLKKQRMLMSSANISTIHAFCLEVLKGNIHHTNLPVDFSIISEVENKTMTNMALDMVLARFYENIDRLPAFKSLVLSHGSDKTDANLRKIILSLLNFARSMAHPAKWLNSSALDYKCEDFISSPWHERLFAYAKEEIKNIQETYEEILSIAEKSLPSDHPYRPFFTLEMEKVNSIATAIGEEDYDKVQKSFKELVFETIPTKRTKEPAEAISQSNIKAFRDLAKKLLGDLSSFFYPGSDIILEQIKENEPQIRTLKNITLMTMRAHNKMKRLSGYLDFNDLEHELISLLEDENKNPSSVAKALQERYKEILVDEYQDTNNAQDTIFSLVSRDNTNVFTVGDIKQCIYKFRNAVPEIFAEKSKRYKISDGGHLIKLSQNFRSRHNVLDFTNYVFNQIMTERSCGIEYKDGEELKFGADYYPAEENSESYCPEFNIVDGRSAEDASVAEASEVAKRIHRLVNKEKLSITDPKTGEVRSVRYSDIVILLRNAKSNGKVFEEVLKDSQIPVYSEIGQSYLDTVEVQTVLSFLEIIDNPYQDIPLIAVLRSPLFRFTPESLANIRSAKKRCSFYEALCEASFQGDANCKKFLDELDALRDEAEYLSVSELILHILNRYNYKEIVSGEENGEIKGENLRLLFERAAEYDETPNGSLFGFMLYIRTLIDAEADLTPAKAEGEHSNSVKIMSIHKSKGLEFPVVILANAFARFNTSDTSRSILWHDSLGFGIPYTDTKRRIKYPSLPHKLISKTLLKELSCEEMRLLYVAMTRAKEKLIISAVIKKTGTPWASPYLSKDKVLTAGILNARSLGDWVSYALARYKGADALQSFHKLTYDPAKNTDKLVSVSVCEPQCDFYDEEDTFDEPITFSEQVDEKLMDKLQNVYPASSLPVKMSVTEAKRRQAEEEIYTPSIFSLPSLSSDASTLSGAEKGTITHFILLHLDMKKASSKEEIEAQLENMVNQGIVSAVQKDAVDISSILNFAQSDLGIRLKDAVMVKKEFSFYSEISAKELYPDDNSQEKILIQGTMDCFFKEASGNIVLLDYKTDRIAEDGAKERGKTYYTQLKLYKYALETILDEKVNEAYLYFLNCDKAISINELK
ncbi:MAG: helicase-exonuclease AddAB subunit AddA [Clostridia bacterium]|nr:helicase-exonuclease AddAB subunit AddA [Clostridia bacterium]